MQPEGIRRIPPLASRKYCDRWLSIASEAHKRANRRAITNNSLRQPELGAPEESSTYECGAIYEVTPMPATKNECVFLYYDSAADYGGKERNYHQKKDQLEQPIVIRLVDSL